MQDIATNRRWSAGIKCPLVDRRLFTLLQKGVSFGMPWLPQGGAYCFSAPGSGPFSRTRTGLRLWFKVIHFMLTREKDIISLRIQHVMGLSSYKTALYLTHRIRAARPR
jgi:hypothetical protein